MPEMQDAYDPYNPREISKGRPKAKTKPKPGEPTVSLEFPGVGRTPEIPLSELSTLAEGVSGHMRGPKKSKIEKAEEKTANVIAAGAD